MDVQDIVDNVAVVGSPINFRAEKTFSGNLKVQNQLRVTGECISACLLLKSPLKMYFLFRQHKSPEFCRPDQNC